MSSSHTTRDAARPPRPLTGGAVLGAASRVSVAVTGAATTILVARLLGADGSGSFAIAQTIVYVLTVLTTLGVEHGIAYYVSRGAWAPSQAFSTAQRVAVGVGLSGALAGLLARLLVPSAFGELSVLEVALAAGALPFALSWFYGSYVALADDHYEGYVLPPAVQSVSLLMLGLPLLAAFGLIGAVLALPLSNAVASMLTVAWRHRLRGHEAGPPPPHALRRALVFGIKGYTANALQVLNYRIDLFLLSAVATTAAVGQYSVAVAVTSVLWLLPQSLTDVLFPRVAALSSGDSAESAAQRDFVEAKSVRHTTVLAVGSALVLAVALVFLVVPVYGPEFQPSVRLGLIRLPGVALLGIAGALSAPVLGRGLPKYGLYTALITTPLTLALYITLIPAYAATGAAVASSLSFATNFIVAAWFYRRVTGRGVARLLVPTRSELDDYRALAPKLRAWAAALRDR